MGVRVDLLCRDESLQRKRRRWRRSKLFRTGGWHGRAWTFWRAISGRRGASSSALPQALAAIRDRTAWLRRLRSNISDGRSFYRPLVFHSPISQCSGAALEAASNRKGEERTPHHSITSSARAISEGGTVRPSSFAV